MDALTKALAQHRAEIRQDRSDAAKAAKKKSAKPPSPVPKSKHLPIPGLEFLGAGYNVFGRYASADDVKANIFDFSVDGTVDQQLYDESLPQIRSNVENAFQVMPTEIKLIYARPPGVQFKPLFQARLDFTESGSMTEEQQSLTAHADIEGTYGLFSGEINARYSSNASKLATARCYSATALMRYYDLSMANFPLHPVRYVRPTVRKDLNNPAITPEQIFEKYGTHYLYAITIGSKIVYGHTVDSSKTTKSFDIAVELRAKYGEPGAEISGGGGVDYKQSSAQAADAESVKFYAEGVSDEQLQAAERADKNPLAVLKQGWHNPTLIDFPTGALKPIWELCDLLSRRTKLEQAFSDYLSTHQSIVGADADLVPLYLLKSPMDTPCYRFANNRSDTTVDGLEWKLAADDGKPTLYVYAEQKEGTVPLYAYRRPVPPMFGDIPGVQDLLMRYETSRWQSYMTKLPTGWKKASGNPIGWVYDGLAPAPKLGSQDVYVYYPTDGKLRRFLYSTDSEDGRDGGSWRASSGVNDDVPMPSDPLAEQFVTIQRQILAAPGVDPDAAAVLGLKSNVHWRAPTL
jgi:MAC/Perforin domain-containing protein